MTTGTAARTGWQTARGTIAVDRPSVVAILNATPDSFWRGGRIPDDVDAAVRHAAMLLEDGADILDIGGESTRPGAAPVSAADERARVVPLVRAIAQRWPTVPISVDTVKADVASAALDAGAWIINDVSALRIDARLADVVASTQAGVILMHSRGGVDDMASYEQARYSDDPVADMLAELRERIACAKRAGISDPSIVIDPGLGFAKRTEHSVAALAATARFASLGYPVLVGPSRKRFLGELTGGAPADDRLDATIAACLCALQRGARLFRVHDARPVRRALDVAYAIASAGATP